MTEEEKQIKKDQYRFSGYQLPKICLDETGDSYVVLPPHPGLVHTPPLEETERGTWQNSVK